MKENESVRLELRPLLAGDTAIPALSGRRYSANTLPSAEINHGALMWGLARSAESNSLAAF